MGKKHEACFCLKNCYLPCLHELWSFDHAPKEVELYVGQLCIFFQCCVCFVRGSSFSKALQLRIKNNLTLWCFSSRLLCGEAQSFIVFLFSLKGFVFCITILSENYSPCCLALNLYQACVSNLLTNFWGLRMVLLSPVQIWKAIPSKLSKAALPVKDRSASDCPVFPPLQLYNCYVHTDYIYSFKINTK